MVLIHLRGGRELASSRREARQSWLHKPTAVPGRRNRWVPATEAHQSVRLPGSAVSRDFVPQLSGNDGARLLQLWSVVPAIRCVGPQDTRCEIAFPVAAPSLALSPALACAFAEGAVAQAPAYFDGSLTVSRLRPLFRRRLRTSLPHFVSILARNP
jgi:hypothetical protein